jgi:hypothetical protein
MHKERMQNLVRVLREVEKTQRPFDIKNWFDINVYGKTQVDPLDCNTAACAVGWACRDKWMQDQGLEVWGSTPTYGSTLGFSAAEDFFNLTRAEVNFLFSAERYENPSITNVIKRIEIFMHFEEQPK